MKPSERLLSLDVFRGITIAGMILVNSPGNETAYAPLEHAEWHGWTPTDLIFPFFVFIVGVSSVFSLTKRMERGEPKGQLVRQIAQRTLIIFGLGLLLNGFPYYHLSTLRIPGVLQRIALCYFCSAVLFLTTRIETQATILGALLIGYGLLMTLVPVPGFGVGNLTKEGNLAAYVDRLLLSGHMYRKVYDPEGLLSTLPAIATGLLGNLTGWWLRFAQAPTQKTGGLGLIGIVAAIMGWIWGRWFPINKALWTSSYVLFTGGLGMIFLAICYWVIEMRGWRGWSKPFEIFGLNAIAAYVLHILFLKLQNLWHISRMNGKPGNLRIFITDHLFGTWTSPQTGSLLYAVAYTLFWLAILSVLYRKKIFIKI